MIKCKILLLLPFYFPFLSILHYALHALLLSFLHDAERSLPIARTLSLLLPAHLAHPPPPHLIHIRL